MNSTQKILLGSYLPVTAVFLVFDHLFPDAAFVNYLKFITITSLFLSVMCLKKSFPEQKYLTAALFFVFAGDFFLVFCTTYFPSSVSARPLGIMGFAAAYINLIAAFQKRFKATRPEILASLPVAALSLPVFISVYTYIAGPLKYGLIIFSLILCYMSWTCLCTVSRKYYTPTSSKRIALAGILMLICDLGVCKENPAG